MESQNLVLSETLYPSTGHWHEEAGQLDTPLKQTQKCKVDDPDSLKSRFKRLFIFDQAECKGVPLVCWGRIEK